MINQNPKLSRMIVALVIGLPIITLLVAFAIGFEIQIAAKPRAFVARMLNLPQPTPATQTKTAAAVPAVAPGNTDADLAREAKILPPDGVTIPARWGDLGKQLVEKGVIDMAKFESLYTSRGGIDAEAKRLLTEDVNENLKITAQNSGTLLNILWALGLGNKNVILDKGPMVDKEYGGAGNFASTGGWTLAKGDAMDHYSKYKLITLTPDQQTLVEKVAKGIYRPCCGNSTYFPDCNHGMAMLGLLELMASQNVSESDILKAALAVNAFWFPDTYLTIAKYFETQGIEWSSIPPQEALGVKFSSAQGYRQLVQTISPPQSQSGGGGCGV